MPPEIFTLPDAIDAIQGAHDNDTIVQIATLAKYLKLTAADFFVI
jgi:hypothetical protein